MATPFADPPKTARLRVFETREIAGLIFAWCGIRGRPPQWTLPADTLEQAGWSSLCIRTIRFSGHPQDTTENSVDLGHLRYVHGYDSVERIGRISVDRPRLQSDFSFRRVRKIARIAVFSQPRGGTKSLIAELWTGRARELSLFKNRFDIKMCFYVVGGAMLSLNALSGAAYHHVRFGEDVNPGVYLYAAFFTFYVLDYFIIERVQLYTYDLIHDRLGFMLF